MARAWCGAVTPQDEVMQMAAPPLQYELQLQLAIAHPLLKQAS